jgi:Fur family peroxide stress response transcriptional regulator
MDLSTARELIEKHGLRCTRQRELVYATLAASRSHPTAEELLQRVRDDEPGLSLATIYNTLEAFSNVGLCRKFPGVAGSNACRYDADMGDHAHVTTGDGRVIDVPEDLSRQLFASLPAEVIAEVESRMGVRIARVSLQFESPPARPDPTG